MPLRFQRRARISPGISLNFNKRSVSASLDDVVLTLQSGQRVDAPLSVYLERGCPIQFINDPAQVLC
jgi:hypothetical protein